LGSIFSPGHPIQKIVDFVSNYDTGAYNRNVKNLSTSGNKKDFERKKAKMKMFNDQSKNFVAGFYDMKNNLNLKFSQKAIKKLVNLNIERTIVRGEESERNKAK
jgi:hypothetical protein